MDDPPKPVDPPRAKIPAVGDIIAGKYEVERVIGEGGMGVVLAARHKQLGELVAIKLLHPDAARNPEGVARLLREARATLSIKSEHVVRVTDVGTLESGSPYILMECLSGYDLGEVVRQGGPLAIVDAVDYVLQACEAIAEAHARGIVHRDLKPSNLFLTERADGSSLVKVLDFGIAKALTMQGPDSGDLTQAEAQAQVSLTATRTVFGSPAYMSPEQLRSAKRVDERTDIWALGVILFELITGTMPFNGESMPGVLASIAADAPELLRSRRPEAPAGLEEIIARCLIKDPQLRTQNVAELATALEPFAPEGAGLSVQRIIRLGLPAGVSKRVVRSLAPSVASNPALGSTVKAITTSTHPSAPRPGFALVAALAGFLLATVLGLGWMLRSRTRSASTTMAAPSTASLPVAAQPPPAAATILAPSVLPSAVVAPIPPPVASVLPSAHDAGATAAPVQAAHARPTRRPTVMPSPPAPSSPSTPPPAAPVQPPASTDDALNGR